MSKANQAGADGAGVSILDHFKLNENAYVAIRRYLGTRPYDEVRQVIQVLDSLPAVTNADIKLLENASKRLAELEEKNDYLEETLEAIRFDKVNAERWEALCVEAYKPDTDSYTIHMDDIQNINEYADRIMIAQGYELPKAPQDESDRLPDNVVIPEDTSGEEHMG